MDIQGVIGGAIFQQHNLFTGIDQTMRYDTASGATTYDNVVRVIHKISELVIVICKVLTGCQRRLKPEAAVNSVENYDEGKTGWLNQESRLI
tara:strand:+ start:2954 stop:3229 length:276 start_codon:yes stop_codon:yes gene_type:complete